jgi:pyroglutamyl-peptidase
VEETLPELLKRHRPNVVLMFGLAARTRHLRIETRAVNRVSVFPDAQGRAFAKTCIRMGAPSMLVGRAPFQKLLGAAERTRVPVVLSCDAGKYVCNFLYWRALENRFQNGVAPLVVFVHVPKLQLIPRPSRRARRQRLRLNDLVRAGEAILLSLVSAARLSRL